MTLSDLFLPLGLLGSYLVFIWFLWRETLIFREKRVGAHSSTLSDGASLFISFRPVSGCCGRKMGAETALYVRHEPAPGVRCRMGDFVYSGFPLAACPFKRNVLGNSPSPQILNDPKSLYHGPSGASGSDSRHSFSL